MCIYNFLSLSLSLALLHKFKLYILYNIGFKLVFNQSKPTMSYLWCPWTSLGPLKDPSSYPLAATAPVSSTLSLAVPRSCWGTRWQSHQSCQGRKCSCWNLWRSLKFFCFSATQLTKPTKPKNWHWRSRPRVTGVSRDLLSCLETVKPFGLWSVGLSDHAQIYLWVKSSVRCHTYKGVVIRQSLEIELSFMS